MLSMRIWSKNLVLKDCKQNKPFILIIHNLKYYPSTKANSIPFKILPNPKITELILLLVLATSLVLKACILTSSH